MWIGNPFGNGTLRETDFNSIIHKLEDLRTINPSAIEWTINVEVTRSEHVKNSARIIIHYYEDYVSLTPKEVENTEDLRYLVSQHLLQEREKEYQFALERKNRLVGAIAQMEGLYATKEE